MTSPIVECTGRNCPQKILGYKYLEIESEGQKSLSPSLTPGMKDDSSIKSIDNVHIKSTIGITHRRPKFRVIVKRTLSQTARKPTEKP